MPETVITEMQNHKWAMEPNALQVFLEKMSKISAGSLVTTIAVDLPKKKLQVVGGTARINISGVLLKSVPGWMRLWGYDVTGYDEITEQIAEAVAEKTVTAIELAVSSPGGMVAGVEGAASAIYNARSIKPVTAVVEDLAASGAYWLASQAQTISAGRTAEIGSIGVYSVYIDWTGYEEKAGIKIIVIRSGEHKAMGWDKITESQISAVQEIIDSLADQFVTAVAGGRGMSKDDIGKLATGRLWLAEAARDAGLIDTVTVNEGNNNINQGVKVMDTQDTTSVAAIADESKHNEALAAAKKQVSADEKKRLADLKSAFPKDLAFAVEQFEAGASVTEAKAAFADVLQKRLDEKEGQGVEPLQSGDSASSGGVNFIALGKQMAKEQKIPLGQAYKLLAKEQPDLHAAYKQSLGL